MSENTQIRCLWCHAIQKERDQGELCENCGRDMLKPRHRYTVGEFGPRHYRGGLGNGYDRACAWAKLAREKTGARVTAWADGAGVGGHCTCPTEEDYKAVMTWYNKSSVAD